MSLLTVLTYVAIFALVAAVAVTLVTVVVLLRRIRETAGLILFGVRAIAERAKPVGPVVAEINGDLTAVQAALHGLIEKAGLEKEDEEAPDIVEPPEDSRASSSAQPAGAVVSPAGDVITGGNDDA